MNFKVDDEVRVKGAKPVGIIYQPSDSTYGWAAEFETEDKRYFFLDQKRAEALGIELELVEPELPEEPPVGSYLLFPSGKVVDVLQTGYYCHTTGVKLAKRSSWHLIVKGYGTDFTVLEPRDETIREVLVDIYGKDSLEFREQVEHFGVSLDD